MHGRTNLLVLIVAALTLGACSGPGASLPFGSPTPASSSLPLSGMSVPVTAAKVTATAPASGTSKAATSLTESAHTAALQGIDHFRMLAGVPESPVQFVEMTTLINSPDGHLAVARYQDGDGRQYLVEPSAGQVLEYDARGTLSALPPKGPLFGLDQLKPRVEALVAATTPGFADRQAGLGYDEGAKGDLYFFTWRDGTAVTGPDRPNAPFAQVGLHASGMLFAYDNTLGLK